MKSHLGQVALRQCKLTVFTLVFSSMEKSSYVAMEFTYMLLKDHLDALTSECFSKHLSVTKADIKISEDILIQGSLAFNIAFPINKN